MPFAIAAVFAVALLTRISALDLPKAVVNVPSPAGSRWHPVTSPIVLEADEIIYVELVDQLDAGKGYTLQGHPVLNQPWINREQYNRVLFFHPPGGIALFWVAHRLGGERGFAAAQVICFGLFFWSVLALGREVLRPVRPAAAISLAILAAFSPIMAHVAGRFWLDGPVLAFSTAAAALFFAAWHRRSWLLTGIAGVVFGYATLIKLTAFLMLPGIAAVAWAVTDRGQLSSRWRYLAVFVATAVVVQTPWEVIQWRVAGSPFPVWSGKPADVLVRTNPFIYYLTVFRSPWVYLKLLPQVLWTLVPALLLLATQWTNDRLRRVGLALLFWIAAIVGVHIWLGELGYSKLLRYVILVTPAAILLFAACFGELVARLQAHRDVMGRRAITIALVVVALLGVGLEVTQGLVTSFYDNPRNDVIAPLTGLPGFPR